MAVTTDPAGNPAPPGGFKTGGWYSSFQYWDGSFAPRAGAIHPASNQVGAGQPVSREVVRAGSIAAGEAPTAHQEFIDEQNRKLDADNFGDFLNNYQQTVAGSFGPGGDLPQLTDGGGGLIDFENIKSRLEPAGGRPDLLNRVERFETLRGERGVADLEEQLTGLKAQQREMEAQLRINVAGERAKPVAQGVIDRRIGEQTRQSREDLEFINRQQAFITDQLNSAYSVINTYMQLEGEDYNAAVDRYNNEFSQNLQLVNLARGLRQDQLDEQQQQVSNARATLSTYVNAITSGNLSPSQISADQKLTLRRLEVQSGFPIGFVESLDLSANDKLINYNERTGEALTMDASGNFDIIETGATPTPFAGEATSKVEDEQQTQQNLIGDIKRGAILQDVVNHYAVPGGLDINTIYRLYNSYSPYGKAKEEIEDVKAGKFKS